MRRGQTARPDRPAVHRPGGPLSTRLVIGATATAAALVAAIPLLALAPSAASAAPGPVATTAAATGPSAGAVPDRLGSEDPGAPSGPTADAPVTLSFAGYPWTVKSSTAPVGPGPNLFNADGPYVDRSGAMHLRLADTPTGWECSEVVLNPTLGYGTYTWTVHGYLATLSPYVVLALFLYDSADTPPNNGEIDLEISRFDHPDESSNAQYVVQPSAQRGNLLRIRIPEGGAATTFSFTWTPGQVAFHGTTVLPDGQAEQLPRWTNRSHTVPVNSTEQVHMSLWLFRGHPPLDGRNVSVTVSAFTFTRSG